MKIKYLASLIIVFVMFVLGARFVSADDNCPEGTLDETCAQVNVTVAGATATTGSLNATDCTISVGSSSCDTTLTWGTINPPANPSVVTFSSNLTPIATGNSTTPSSGFKYNIGHGGGQMFYLYKDSVNGSNLIASDSATADCDNSISFWDYTSNSCKAYGIPDLKMTVRNSDGTIYNNIQNSDGPNVSVQKGLDLRYDVFYDEVKNTQTCVFIKDFNTISTDTGGNGVYNESVDSETSSSIIFVLVCMVNGSFLSDLITLNILPPSPNISLTATDYEEWSTPARTKIWRNNNVPNNIVTYSGAPYKLSWSSTNTLSCHLDNNSVLLSGDKNTYNAGTTDNWSVTHTLFCLGDDLNTYTKTIKVIVPPMPTASGSCSADGKTGRLYNLNAPDGYNNLYTRAYDKTTYPSGPSGIGEYANYNNSVTATSESFTTTPGHSYAWWVHTSSANDSWSAPILGSFDCPKEGDPIITATNCTLAADVSNPTPTCNTTLNWNVPYPIGNSKVTTSPPTDQLVENGHTGTKTWPLTFGSRTFYLINYDANGDAKTLKTVDAKAECPPGTDWDGNMCKSTASDTFTITTKIEPDDAGYFETSPNGCANGCNVNEGSTPIFEAVANSGYVFDHMVVNNGPDIYSNQFTFPPIDDNNDITAYFEPSIVTQTYYTITPTSGPNGSINPSGPTQVLKGGSLTFYFNPSPNYKVLKVLVGDSQSTLFTVPFNKIDNSYKFTDVQKNYDIKVEFRKKTIYEEI